MRSISSQNQAALQARRLVARDFIWFTVRDRSTGNPVNDAYWSDTGTITASVIDPNTGNTVSRTWFGAGSLISTSDIPLVSNLTVQNVTITLSQISSRVNDLLRTYDAKQGGVEVYRGMFDPLTRTMVDPAMPRFVGTIDDAPIVTPKENANGNVTLNCTSNTQELTRANSDTRSDASQKLRSATDDFYKDTAVVFTWQQYWGRASGTVPTARKGFMHDAFGWLGF